MGPQPPAGKPNEGGGLPALPAGQASPPARSALREAGRRGGPLPPALAMAPSALGLLKALRRRWLLAASAGLAVAAALGVAAFFLAPPPKHTVRTLIHLPPPKRFFVPNAGGAPDLPNFQRNQVAMMKSRLVLNAALHEPGVAQLSVIPANVDPIEWLEQEVQADFSVAPEVFRIALSGDKPDELKTLVNALRKAFIREVIDVEAGQRRDKLTKLKEARGKLEEEVKAARAEQKKIDPNPIIRDPAMRALVLNFVQQQLRAAEQELIKTRSELLRASLQLKAEQDREAGLGKAAVPAALVDAQVGQHPAVKELAAKVKNLQLNVDRNLAKAALGKDDPGVRQLQEQLNEASQALAKERDRVRPEVEELVRKKAGAEAVAKRVALQDEVARLEGVAQKLKPEVDELRTQVKKLADKGTQLEEREDFKLAQAEKIAERLAAEEAVLEVEQAAPPHWRVMEEAEVNHELSKAKRALIPVGAAAAGLGLVLLAVGYWEFRARRVSTVDEVADGLGLAVVGALPDATRRLPRRLLPGGASAEECGQALLTESIDATRTVLLHAAQLESVQVVMVTSALPGEGKTSLSCHLAASLARVGLKTLLIDGDLRNPTAHLLFELPNEAGFSDLLRGEAEPAAVTQPTAVDGLSLISAGRWDYQAAQGLAQGRTRALLIQLRREYDFILIDSSPVLAVADALLVGQSADAAVFSVLRDVSRLPSVYAALQRLTVLGIRALGAVVNGVPGELYVSSYKYMSGAKTAPEEGLEAVPDAGASAPQPTSETD